MCIEIGLKGYSQQVFNAMTPFEKGKEIALRILQITGIVTVILMGMASLRGTFSPVAIGSTTIVASGLSLFAASVRIKAPTASERYACLTTFALGILMVQSLINPLVFGGIAMGIHLTSLIFNDLVRKCGRSREDIFNHADLFEQAPAQPMLHPYPAIIVPPRGSPQGSPHESHQVNEVE